VSRGERTQWCTTAYTIIKIFQIRIFRQQKKAAHSELPLFINGKVAGNVNIAFLNLLTGGLCPGIISEVNIPLT
jgi:hypothetical protein